MADGESRNIRVFVSSTFRDMGEERDELVKHTFPALRKLCESRGVAWGEVDLRWGVTDEQRAEGQVLPICMAEIRGCRPYFIGLLGERYGWIPDVIDPALVEDERWLGDMGGRSVTELEILQGVLNDPAMAGHALFYLRDPAYVEGKPAEQYREVATAAEVAQLGADRAEQDAADRRAKLAALKDRIRRSGMVVRENYPDPRTLGELALADLTAVVDSVFPAGSEPDPLAREAFEHESFARGRSSVYIGRPEYFDNLDAHAAGEGGAPLVVLGDSGSGKSALLANWALRYRDSHPDEAVFLEFIGATASSTDWRAIARRLIAELSRRFDLDIEIPDNPDALRAALGSTLQRAATKGRTILVVDALDQLEDREGALDLTWLPEVMPQQIRVVLSTLPGRPLTELQRRRYPTLTVAQLELEERERLIDIYLAGFTKTISRDLRQLIAASAPCANPLFLRALLDELRLWGEHETLRNQVEHYLTARSVEALYELILARLEQDYDRDRPGLVRDAFTFLWAARRGLAESELLDLLGTGDQPLPGAHWSPLLLAAEASLANRSGLLGFFHEYLRVAVEHRYLPADAHKARAHLDLAGYFSAGEIRPRVIDELPWQLARASAWDNLADLLANLEFLDKAWDADQFQVRAFWAEVEANSPLRMVYTYEPVLDSPLRHPSRQVYQLARLLDECGHPQQALSLFEHLTWRYREAGDQAAVQASLNEEATLLHARGDLNRAMALHAESERICRELGDQPGLLVSLGNQANILEARGDLDGAMRLLREAEQICLAIGDREHLQTMLGNQAVILMDRGDLDGAMALHKEQARLCRELGHQQGLSTSLINQANVLYVRGDFDGAMTLLEESARICRELGDPATLQVALGNQANILVERGDLDGATVLRQEQERICLELDDRAGLAHSLGAQGRLLKTKGDLDGAMLLLRQQEQICRELDDRVELARSLSVQADVLQGRGDLDGALRLHRQEEEICRGFGIPARIRAALSAQAEILETQGDQVGALSLHGEMESICRELGYPEDLALELAAESMLLSKMGRWRKAKPLAEEAYRIATEHSLDIAPQIERVLWRMTTGL